MYARLFLGVALLRSAALFIDFTAAHGHDLQGSQLTQYRRSYTLKDHDLWSRCSSHLQERRSRRAFELMLRQAAAPVRRSYPGPTNAITSEHLSTRAANRSPGTCLLTPEVRQGPFHLLGDLIRQDIRDGQPGIPLHLHIDFVDVDSCEPLKRAWVDVWGVNATGYYSGYESLDDYAPPKDVPIVDSASVKSFTAGADTHASDADRGGGGIKPTNGNRYNRGVWQTDDDGVLEMLTIVPGWYLGRAPHIHLKVYEAKQGYRASNATFIVKDKDKASHHTGQWFFPQELMDVVAHTAPYDQNKLPWSSATSNIEDVVYPYANSMGAKADLDITYVDRTDIAKGLVASTVVGINTTYTSIELTRWYWSPDEDDAE